MRRSHLACHLLDAAAAVLILLCVLGIVLPSRAQVVTPIQSGMIFDLSTETMFPEAIRFTASVHSPSSELSRVTLTIEPQGRPPVDVLVTLSESLVSETETTELQYVWEIPDGYVLEAFSDVSFSWRVATTRNRTGRTNGRFTFTDGRVVWNTEEDPDGHIRISAPANTIDPANLRDSVTDLYNLLAENVGQTPFFSVVVYPPSLPIDPCETSNEGQSVIFAAISGTEVPCELGVAEAVYRESGFIPLKVASGDGADELSELLVQGFYESTWQGGCASAFQSGLGQFYRADYKFLLLDRASCSRLQWPAVQPGSNGDSARRSRPAKRPGERRAMVWCCTCQSNWCAGTAAINQGCRSRPRSPKPIRPKPPPSSFCLPKTGYSRKPPIPPHAYNPFQPTTPTPTPSRTPTPSPTPSPGGG
jgi:hypothetical protein